MYLFNPTTYAITKLYGTNYNSLGAREATGSFVTPTLFFNVVNAANVTSASGSCGKAGGPINNYGTDLVLYWECNASTTTAPTFANGGRNVFVDLNTACGSSLPSGLQIPDDEVSGSRNDNVFTVIGATTAGQNSSEIYAIAYNVATSTCYVWNTSTGLWYINGVSQGYLTIYDSTQSINFSSSLVDFSIHQLRMNTAGTVVEISEEAPCLVVNPPYCAGLGIDFWNLATGNFYERQDTVENLASAMYLGSLTSPGSPGSSLPIQYPSGNSCTGTAILDCDPVGQDRHTTGANNTNDKQPYLGAFANDSGGPQNWNMVYGWSNELTAQQTSQSPGSNLTWRITHTYNTTGWTSGNPTFSNCSINGTYTCRYDVFLVVMPLNASTSGATISGVKLSGGAKVSN